MFTLSGRTAIVTGGSRGIGYAIGRALAQSGMNVAILSKNEVHAAKAAAKLTEQGYSCRGFACDVSDVNQISSVLKNIFEFYNAIDVLVNCAGILDTLPIEELTEEVWDNVLDTNLKGTFFMTQKVIPYLEKSHAPRIINISSNAGRMGGYENGLAYSASKGGIISLTYAEARRLAPKNITVNCVAPGTIESDMSQTYDQDAHERLLSRFPLGRLGTPEEVAAAVCYFASEEAAFTTGAVLDVNGGLFMG
ncbi:SDR family NAD(P)-dependent oxidoreductase [Pseudoflavonifractor phocaeensis]|uniref:SDR family NAD(P)-dependent oxidoreductase n=1 Tax=Pseudoflavonifractor phocaeensis TaxID=1870988 RepID=UPI00195D4200|nr:3-oxoacyl-ACP reductase family protein [Pseudoflavonifractor phocaeensis]MBM6721512.1 3-oxoacyl-ACP reductase FabG [Pseudoflavonifractor phocaeensis]